MANAKQEPMIRVENLKKYFPITAGIFSRTVGHVKAVDDISFEIMPKETLGLVGESGCGKTTTGRTVLKLLEPTEGDVYFKGKNVFEMNNKELRDIRKEVQIIFQDPFGSLNPRMKVGDAIGEALLEHGITKTPKETMERVKHIMEVCGLAPFHYRRYPHEFSGGQRQRIGIARALILNPQFIVADEPISALDVSIQAQIINLLEDLQEEFGLTYLFISHDLSVVKHICDRVGVMYVGKMVELAPKKELYDEPLHPYTQALLSAVPVMDPTVTKERIILKGDVPSPSNPPSGCRFHTRCPYKMDICVEQEPEFREARPGHFVACHLIK
ncbi:MAG: dipeptide ABC transporter ATP-binding protein [Firmicutes bacterium]|nr:dipeptide ABC transporter ATP-binding protein [Bacillota bacterium]